MKNHWILSVNRTLLNLPKEKSQENFISKKIIKFQRFIIKRKEEKAKRRRSLMIAL
jgi:hypothetical protein